jgi:hypothetical protein
LFGKVIGYLFVVFYSVFVAERRGILNFEELENLQKFTNFTKTDF